jgi:hypothetical protein
MTIDHDDHDHMPLQHVGTSSGSLEDPAITTTAATTITRRVVAELTIIYTWICRMPPITTAIIHIHSTGHPGFLSCQGLVLLLALPNNLMLSKIDLDDDDGTHSDISMRWIIEYGW